jgi:antitoxin CcdA
LSWVTVSAKVRRELYEKLRRYGVRVSEVIRRALEEEVEKREEEEARNALRHAQMILRKIPSDELVVAVRSTRDEG